MSRNQYTIYAGIIGCPISHSLSPKLHRYWLKKYHINGAYFPIEVKPENLETFLKNVARFKIKGLNITVPHKEKAIRYVDSVSESAMKIGAINTLFVDNDGKLSATNTDITGFLNNLDYTIPGWQKIAIKCIVLGAGGAARAVVAALEERGVKEIIVINRNKNKAVKLSNFFSSNVVGTDWSNINDALSGIDMLINTTTLGMVNQPELQINLDLLKPSSIVYDLVYAPNETKLLAQARKRNLQSVSGLGMLLHQAVDGFEGWFGLRPEVDKNLENFILYDK